ncbi:MAG: SulP family inorganic anion transporter [Thermodesulfobacteriota bacterium]
MGTAVAVENFHTPRARLPWPGQGLVMAVPPPEIKGSRLPLLQGLLPLKWTQVPADIMAGVTLAALNIPQALGYTKIAGTPVITGLYAILLPMSIFAVFGSSRHLVVGADSATAAVLAAGLGGMATAGSPEYMALCGLLALMAAGLLILARIIGLGFLADFLSRTVLVGFLTGVGLQVSLMEIGGMLGLPRGPHTPMGSLLHDLQHLSQTNFYTLAVSATVLVIILGSQKISKKIPGALIAVIGAIVVSWTIDLPSYGVATLGAVPQGLPQFGWPQVDLNLRLLKDLSTTAFSIFVVILAQSAATSQAFAARFNESFDEKMDLLGLGLANVGAGLSGAFVVNGSPTATEMVDSAGGRTQLSQITSSIVVLLVLLFLTGPLAYMPAAVLSTVVVLICVHLIDVQGLRQIYRERPWEFWVALITATTVVLVGVKQGILLALFLSLAIHTRHGYRPHNALVAQDPEGGWNTLALDTQAQFLPGLLIYRFTHGMYYANAGVLAEEVTNLTQEAKRPLTWFCIDAAAVDDVDFTAAATLRTLHGIFREKEIRLVFSEVSPGVYAQLERSGIVELMGQDAFYDTAFEMVRAYRRLGPAP